MKSFKPLKLGTAVAGTLLLVAVAGCGRDGIKVYQVDATNDFNTVAPMPVAGGLMPTTLPDGMPVPDNSGLPSLKYTLPAGWETKAPSQMRVASFGVSQGGQQADISVIPLGGAAGSDPANVNRWRGQVGLDPLTEADLAGLAEKVVVGEQPADLYDLAGSMPGSAVPQRIIAVILHRNDTAWFFKMTGPAAWVAQQKTAFTAFLKSIVFEAPIASSAPIDRGTLPPSHPPIREMNSGSVPMTSSAGDKPTWTVPAGWQEGPLAQFLVAKYVIHGTAGAQAAVNISQLAGDGGGLLPNVNRWRTQLGQPPLAESDLLNLPTVDASGGKATVIEFAGTDGRTGKPARLVGLVLPLGAQTWFYKLMGDAELVAQQKEALTRFVQSATYPDAH